MIDSTRSNVVPLPVILTPNHDGRVWPPVYAAPTYATFGPVTWIVRLCELGTAPFCRAENVAEVALIVNAPLGCSPPEPLPPLLPPPPQAESTPKTTQSAR
jgi:hypothetical protein